MRTFPAAFLPALLLTFTGMSLAATLGEIRDKTLIVWVSPSDLDQRRGSALTLDDTASHFDGIVFAELSEKRWMAGSNYHDRSQRDQENYAQETVRAGTLVQMAITYKGNEITLYRNAELYARYTVESQQVFPPESVIVFGRRHLEARDNSCFRGKIDDARIYPEALTQGELSALKPGLPGDKDPWAWFTFENGNPQDLTGRFMETVLLGGAKIEDDCLVLEGLEPTMVAAPPGFFSTDLWKPSNQSQDALTEAQRKHRERLLSDPHRPTWHFVSPEGPCMPFDPNGAIFWEGRYHLCYIFQDDRGHCWGHASSADLLHWQWHDPALFPAPGDVDKGIFSGNCFVNKKGEATMLYHGVGAGNCIAVSSEPGLDHWIKPEFNPIVPIPPEGSPESKLYRSWDPHGWLEGDTYYAIFGGNPPTLFKAKELNDWSYVGNFLPNDMPDVDDFEDVSCPDFFPLGDKHLLLCISHPRGCRYYLGRWEDEVFRPESHHRMNWPGGTCFAPESLLDGQGRRIMWAWVLDRRPGHPYGWSGTMTMPRVLSLREDGSLGINPPKELESLRTKQQALGRVEIKEDEMIPLDLQGDSLELAFTITPQDAKRYGVKVRCSPDGSEETVVAVEPQENKLSIDVSKSSLADICHYTFCMKGGPNPEVTVQSAPFQLQEGEPLQLRIFLDRSILEVFANGRQCVTQRIYPVRNDSLGVAVFSQGGSVAVEGIKAWTLSPTNAW